MAITPTRWPTSSRRAVAAFLGGALADVPYRFAATAWPVVTGALREVLGADRAGAMTVGREG